jgi:hypothetical protein
MGAEPKVFQSDRWQQGARALALVRIAITVEAFEAIARTLPLGSVGYETEVDERGERIWLEDAMADRLSAMRGPNESYSEPFCGWSGWRRRQGSRREPQNRRRHSNADQYRYMDSVIVQRYSSPTANPLLNHASSLRSTSPRASQGEETRGRPESHTTPRKPFVISILSVLHSRSALSSGSLVFRRVISLSRMQIIPVI